MLPSSSNGARSSRTPSTGRRARWPTTTSSRRPRPRGRSSGSSISATAPPPTGGVTAPGPSPIRPTATSTSWWRSSRRTTTGWSARSGPGSISSAAGSAGQGRRRPSRPARSRRNRRPAPASDRGWPPSAGSARSKQVVQLHEDAAGPGIQAPVRLQHLQQGHRRPERRQVAHRGRLDVASLALAHEIAGVEQERPPHPDERLIGRVVVLPRLDLAPGGVGDPGPARRLVLRQPEPPSVLADVLPDRHPVDPVRLLALRRYGHDPSCLPSRTCALRVDLARK